LTVEFDDEEVLSGQMDPSLWQGIRTGDFSNGGGKLTVTELDEERDDELIWVLSDG